MGAWVAMAAAALALAGCTAEPKGAGEPFRMPQELAWQFVTVCIEQGDLPESVGITAFTWGDGDASVTLDGETPESDAAAVRIEDCLDLYRYDNRPTMPYVSAYERARLYDYYARVTAPCLSAHGAAAPAVARADFFVPDERPWNPYTSMADVPFTRVLELYEACPPVPQDLLSRHAR